MAARPCAAGRLERGDLFKPRFRGICHSIFKFRTHINLFLAAALHVTSSEAPRPPGRRRRDSEAAVPRTGPGPRPGPAAPAARVRVTVSDSDGVD